MVFNNQGVLIKIDVGKGSIIIDFYRQRDLTLIFHDRLIKRLPEDIAGVLLRLFQAQTG